MNAETAIVLRELGKRFSPDAAPPALDGLNAEIPGGAVSGVVGPDAAGKTTLMRLLAGLLRPSSGEVLYRHAPRAVAG